MLTEVQKLESLLRHEARNWRWNSRLAGPQALRCKGNVHRGDFDAMRTVIPGSGSLPAWSKSSDFGAGTDISRLIAQPLR